MSDYHPNQILAQRIIASLAAAGLIRAEDKERLEQQLAAGSLRENDWRAVLEAALRK
jgi:hypothetical protein